MMGQGRGGLSRGVDEGHEGKGVSLYGHGAETVKAAGDIETSKERIKKKTEAR